MLVHLLAQPLGRDPKNPTRMVWATVCDRRVSMPVGPNIKPGESIQMHDQHGQQLVECGMCHQAIETSSEPQRTSGDEEPEPTLDEELGELGDDTLGGYDDGNDTIEEERVDYPER